MPDVIVSRPMASRTTHPLPILPGGPWCPTQDEAIELFVQYQGAGHIRRCAYALVEGVAHQEWRVHIYRVACKKNSFEVDLVPLRPGQRGEPGILFKGCPKNCQLYRAAWKDRLFGRPRRPHRIRWFTALKWRTQVALIAAVIILAATYFSTLGDLSDLIRALSDAWHQK